jgi:type II secretory pathway component PulF
MLVLKGGKKREKIFMPEYDFVAGEKMGKLPDALKILASQTQRKKELNSKINKALVWPAVIFVAIIVFCVITLMAVVPPLTELSGELGIVPTPTARAIISARIFMIENWPWLLLSILGFLVLLFTATKVKAIRKIMHVTALRIPLVSGIVQKTNSVHLMGTLSSLMGAGIPMEKSLEISSCVMENTHFKEAAGTAAQRALNGEKLFETMRGYENILPSLSLPMLETGEERGESPAVLAELADFFEEKAIDEAKNLTQTIESVLMLVLGALAGFFAVSAIQPIYSLFQIMR